MRKIGLFLGVTPSNGGMFQYALSILDALENGREPGDSISVYYIAPLWRDILKPYSFKGRQLKFGKAGIRIAELILALHIPGSLARVVSRYINPIVWQLQNEKNDLWIFPAQDILSYQVSGNVLSTVHDLMHIYESGFPEVSKGFRKNLRDFRFKNLAFWAKGILVDSEIGRQHVAESYQIECSKIYSLPYIPPKYIFENKQDPNFQKRYQLPPKYVFYPAQFWMHKNHKILVEAISLLVEKLPDITMVFTGSKNHQYEEIKELIDQKGLKNHFFFTNYIPAEDIPMLYKRARAMIMPTFFGPTNIPPLEAFATGCPCAVSDIYGMQEQVAEAALLFDPESITEVQSALFRLWTDDLLCNKLVEKGFEKVNCWNLKAFSIRLYEIMDSLN